MRAVELQPFVTKHFEFGRYFVLDLMLAMEQLLNSFKPSRAVVSEQRHGMLTRVRSES